MHHAIESAFVARRCASVCWCTDVYSVFHEYIWCGRVRCIACLISSVILNNDATSGIVLDFLTGIIAGKIVGIYT